MSSFTHLFTPLKIGNCTVKNRMMTTAHLTHMASTEGLPTNRQIAYHEERAKGGVGLIVTESMAVSPDSAQSQYVVHLYDDKVIPMLSELTRRVKAHGTVIIAQLHHMGREMTSLDTRRAVVAPSPIPDPLKKEVPHELTIREVKNMVGRYASAAERCVQAGYDGLEVHLAHGYLIHEFLSPIYNYRTDEYGGSYENRLRFAQEVIRAVRAAAPDKILGIRINGDDFVDGGLSAEDYQRVCVDLEKEGLDYLGLSVGHNLNYPPIFPNMDFPLGFAAYLASGIKRLVEIPVYTSHRINDPVLAEKILAEGHADLIGMTRATIADPDMPNKAREGRLDDIRPCIGCLQGCFQRLRYRAPISCFGNARVGQETAYRIVPAIKQKRVVVVGGGPAGLEAARVLRERGHRVTLYEKDQELGGMLRRGAYDVPNRQELFDVTRWQIRQVEKLGVEVHLGHEAGVQDITAGGYDAVIVATGATYREPSAIYTPDVPHLNVTQALDLGEKDVHAKRVLVIDKDYHNKALGIGEKLGSFGAEVVLFTEEVEVGYDMEMINRSMAWPRLREYGVRSISKAKILETNGNHFLINHEGWEHEMEFDLVVVVDHMVANNALALLVQRELPDLETHLVGNCLAPRKTPDAIHDGLRIALEI
ncbi:MAG: FAD-dependent oxidoreductase [Firmicutes bacterium]|nr:FAD-dependent oxidoreductase [Bacillota bacterium]